MASPIVLNTEGLLLNWLKEVGEQVKSGEVIAEIEADKATVEIEAPADGVLLEQAAEVGEELDEGAVIGQIGEEGEAPAESEAPEQKPEAAPETGQEQPAEAAEQSTSTNGTGAATTPEGRIKASPLARNIAEDKGIDLSQVTGSGPGGRIVKADVENFTPGQAKPAAAPQKGEKAARSPVPGYTPPPLPVDNPDVEIVDVSRMRARIAASTVESQQQIPHFYVTREIAMEPLMALRKEINAGLESKGIKVSVNDLIVKAAALTLREFPNLNTHFYGDKLVIHKRIHIGIAVALPQGGLINVVAKDADKIALGTLAELNKDMIARAREGKIKPEDVQGSTFTVSNMGPQGVDFFSAIINPPEAGILAIGSGKRVPIVNEEGELDTGLRMKVTISVDHRVSDGAEGAEYLDAFKQIIENPMRLLV